MTDHDDDSTPPVYKINELRQRLDIRDGVIYYKLYQQDGSMTEMTCADTVSNCRFIEWVKVHDRYSAPVQS